MTNREWLRSLTDEEIAYFLHDEQGSVFGTICNMCVYGDGFCIDNDDHECCKGIAKWLREEHKDND